MITYPSPTTTHLKDSILVIDRSHFIIMHTECSIFRSGWYSGVLAEGLGGGRGQCPPLRDSKEGRRIGKGAKKAKIHNNKFDLGTGVYTACNRMFTGLIRSV